MRAWSLGDKNRGEWISLRLESGKASLAVIDWGALEGGLVLEAGAVVVLSNLVLVQERMGPNGAMVAALAAGNNGRAIIDTAGCSIFSRSCEARPSDDALKLEGRPGVRVQASPGRPYGLLVRSGSRVQAFSSGGELELRMSDTIIGCGVCAGPPVLLGRGGCSPGSTRRSVPKIRPAGVPFAPSALLACVVSSAMVLGAGVRSKAGWMRRWARSFGRLSCLRCHRCKYDAPDATTAMSRLEPLCIEVPYLNDPTMAMQRLDAVELGGLQLGSPLGRGGFGRVYKAFHNNSVMAVKVIEHDARMLQAGLGEPLEALLSMHLDHPNVIKTYLKQTRGRNSVQASLSTSVNWQSCQSAEKVTGRTRSLCNVRVSGDQVDGELDDIDDFSYIEQNLRASATFADEEETYRTWIVMEFCDRGSLNLAIRYICILAEGI